MPHDPVEDVPRSRKFRDEVEQEIRARMKKDGWPEEPLAIGWCHVYWEYKKRVLKEKYGISWKSPADRNPDVLYD